MSILDLLFGAFRSLFSNVLRALLMTLAIIIGIGAVIGVTALAEGAQQGVTDRIRGLGSNLMFVRPGAIADQGGIQLPGQGPSLFFEDALAIDQQQYEFVDGVAGQSAVGGPGELIQARVIYRGQNTTTVLVGTEPSYQHVRDFFVAQGRFLNEDDINKKALNTVLGAKVARALFGDDNPIGESVRISAGVGNFGVGFNFVVVGVMEEKGASATNNQDDVAFVPLPSFQARIPFLRNPRGFTNVSQINIKLTDDAKAGDAKDTVAQLLRERHGVVEDDFSIQSQSDVLSTATEVERSLQVLLASIATISLVVGAISIMAIMLMSVTERTREIGIRKAIGAKRTDIMLQFLVEALVITTIGGILGIAVGIGASYVADRWDIGQDRYVVAPFWIFAGLAMSAATGLISGLYPAWRAARLDPIEALRHE